MDNVQNCDSYINILSSQTYSFYITFLLRMKYFNQAHTVSFPLGWYLNVTEKSACPNLLERRPKPCKFTHAVVYEPGR
jgi:hypothetical protein